MTVKKGNRKTAKDRNLRAKTWRPLVPFLVPPEAAASRVVAAFQNHLVTIFIKETDSPSFTDPAGQPQKIAHLMIGWSDMKRRDEIPYKYLQKAKAELCGEQADAVQLYPAAWREENFKQTHLWVLPQGAAFPIGIIPSDLEQKASEVVGGRENLVTKDELELFVVKHEDDTIEVFASEDECKEMYGDNKIPEASKSGIEMIGSIPPESTACGWSVKAKVKLANVLAKGQTVGPPPVEEIPTLFNENDNENFDPKNDDPVDDSIPEEDDFNAPAGVEEKMALGDAMRKSIKDKSKRRATDAREAADSVISTANKNIEDAKSGAKAPSKIILTDG